MELKYDGKVEVTSGEFTSSNLFWSPSSVGVHVENSPNKVHEGTVKRYIWIVMRRQTYWWFKLLKNPQSLFMMWT